MNHAHRTKLAKILALADSSHDGEAVAAMRMARQLLAQAGMNFTDLVRTAPAPVPSEAGRMVRMLETQVADLRARLQQEQHTAVGSQQDLAHARVALTRLESALGQSREEVEKWRRLARDTADKLWDIGQQIEQDRLRVRGHIPAKRSAPVGFARERRFVRNSLLEAQEIEPVSHKA